MGTISDSSVKYKKYVTIFFHSGLLDAGNGERHVGVVIEESAERICADAIVKEEI